MAHQGEIWYHIPFLYILDGSLDEERLRRAVAATVAAHPTLFTRIELTPACDPMQTIDDAETFELGVEGMTDVEAVKRQFIRPFDILSDRLFRIRLFKDSEHYYVVELCRPVPHRHQRLRILR